MNNKINFALTDKAVIDINGEEYTILPEIEQITLIGARTIEHYNQYLALQKQTEALELDIVTILQGHAQAKKITNKGYQVADLEAGVQQVFDLAKQSINNLLGETAYDKISNGRSIGIANMMAIVNKCVELSLDKYNSKVSTEYQLDGDE
jgi:hypothetical protein